jgi:hypothetical protein
LHLIRCWLVGNSSFIVIFELRYCFLLHTTTDDDDEACRSKIFLFLVVAKRILIIYYCSTVY